MVLAGGGTQGGHCVGYAVLGQGDHIHVALHHIEAVGLVPALAPFPQAVQFLALVEDGGFRAVQVFGLAVAEHPAAEADGASAAVADRKLDAVAEFVVGAAAVFPAHQQAGGEGLFDALVVQAQALAQVVVARRREAQAVAGGDLAGEAAALEVIHRFLALRGVLELLAVEAFRPGQQVVQGLQAVAAGFFLAGVAAALPGHFQAGPGGQLLHRFRKAEVVVFHQEAHGVAGGAAAEAVVELLVRGDGEGGRLFLVEGAAGGIVAAGLLQRHAGIDQRHQIGAREQVLDEVFGNAAGHGRESSSQ